MFRLFLDRLPVSGLFPHGKLVPPRSSQAFSLSFMGREQNITSAPLISLRLLKDISVTIHIPGGGHVVVPLTPNAKRVQLLAYIAWRRGELIDRDKILEHVFGWGSQTRRQLRISSLSDLNPIKSCYGRKSEKWWLSTSIKQQGNKSLIQNWTPSSAILASGAFPIFAGWKILRRLRRIIKLLRWPVVMANWWMRFPSMSQRICHLRAEFRSNLKKSQ